MVIIDNLLPDQITSTRFNILHYMYMYQKLTTGSVHVGLLQIVQKKTALPFIYSLYSPCYNKARRLEELRRAKNLFIFVFQASI